MWERGSGETYSCEFENFGSQVLKHGSHIHGRLGADAHLVLCVLLEETLDTTTWELCEPGLADCVEHWCAVLVTREMRKLQASRHVRARNKGKRMRGRKRVGAEL